MMRVAVVGAGYVGLVTGLCLADHGHHVSCVDVNAARIADLSRGVLPLYEAGLEVLLERHLGAAFVPTTDLAAAVNAADVTIIAVGTPLEHGAISLRFVGEASAAIGRALIDQQRYHVVVVKSTVVPGTTEEFVRPILERASGKKAGADFGLGMNPEFLREGEAVEDFQNPDRIVLGAIDGRSLETARRLYVDFSGVSLICTTPRTAEMIKYASNALLATLISFSNEIGNLCSVAPDVDVMDVLGAVHLDKRISPIGPDGSRITPGLTAYLKAGCGFGGSCFPKDVRALIRWGEENGRPTPILCAVLAGNDQQPSEVLGLLRKHFPALSGLRVTVLGLAFKPGTDDVRESPALCVIRDLAVQGAHVTAYDPVAMLPASRALRGCSVEYASNLRDAVSAAEAVLLLTAWSEFKELPAVLGTLTTCPVVIDGRRLLDKHEVSRYEGIGLGVSTTSTQSAHSVGPA